VNVAVSSNVGVFANVATSFQTPTTTELINAPPAPGEECCPGGFNVDLEPQRATSFEAGMRARIGARMDLQASAFTMDVTDAIVALASIDGRDFFRNAAETRHRGIELAVAASAGPVQGSAAWTWSDFTFVDDGDPDESFEGNQMPGVSPHHLHLRGSVRLPLHARIEMDLDHAAEYPTNDANSGPGNPAATVLDLRLSLRHTFGGLAVEPFLALQNLTDETYFSSVVVNQVAGRYYEPAPGRNVYFGVTIGTGGWGTR
jgi:iron complex outermembrane receptor protein